MPRGRPTSGPRSGGDIEPGETSLGSTRSAHQALVEMFGLTQPTLPDYPHLPSTDPRGSRVGSHRINQIAPPSPREFYLAAVALDDIVPRNYGDCWCKGKPWIIEQDQTQQTHVFVAYVFGELEVEAPAKMRVGDREINIGGSGNSRTVDGGTLFLGDPAQDLSSNFDTHVTGTYTDTHANMVVWFKAFPNDQFNGLPIVEIKAQWANDVYDPRDFRSIRAGGTHSAGHHFAVADHANLRLATAMTLDGWFNLDSGATLANDRSIIQKTTASAGYELKATDGTTGRPQARLWINTTTPIEKVIDMPADFAAIAAGGRPVHVAMSYLNTSQRFRLYVNGCLAVEETYAESNGNMEAAFGSLLLNATGLDWGFRAARWWGLERTPEDIRNDFDQHQVGNEASLQAYWPVDDAVAAGTVLDKTVNNHDATKTLTNVTVDAERVVGLGPASWAVKAYTENPALIGADVVDRASGGALKPNWEDVAVTADHDDTDITAHPGVPRGTFNACLDKEQDWSDWLDYIAEHGFYVWWQEGDRIRFRPDWIRSPDFTLTEDDIVPKSLNWVNGDPGYEEIPERVAVRYMDGDEEDTAYDQPPVGSERFLDFRVMLGYNTHGAARRYGRKIKATYDNEPYLLQCDVIAKGAEYQRWDVGEITVARLGLSSEDFRLVSTPRLIRPSIRRCFFKRYSAVSYNETNEAAPTINLSTIPSVRDIPTGPLPSLVEVFEFVAPTTLRVRVRISEPDWPHMRAIHFEFWNAGETAMLIAPAVILMASMIEVSAGPPRVLDAVFDAPVQADAGAPTFDFKVRTLIESTMHEVGDASAYVQRVFASGFEDPAAIPLPSTVVVTERRIDHDAAVPPGFVTQVVDVSWAAPVTYVYGVSTLVILESDEDQTQTTWVEVARREVPPGQLETTFPEFDNLYVQRFLHPTTRIRLRHQSPWGGDGAFLTTPIFTPGDLDPSLTGANIITDPFVLQGEIDQAIFTWNTLAQYNYLRGFRIRVKDVTLNETVNYTLILNAGDVRTFRIEGCPIDPLDVGADDTELTFPKTYSFQPGRTYEFSIAALTRDLNSISNYATFSIIWDNLVSGGLDATFD